MPYLCSHLAFGVRVASALGAPAPSPGDAYVLGCFGPDVYFFDRLPPTPFVPHQKKHGNALHALDSFALFSALWDAADDSLKPYLRGFLTHIALDSAVHPYIEARHRGIDHTRFEGVIDAIVYEQTKADVPYKAYLETKPDAAAIDALLSGVSETLLHKDVRGAYKRSVWKFCRLAPVLFDPNGKRYRILNRLERAIRKDGLLSAFLLAAPRRDDEDCMNLSRAPWRSPWAQNVERTESVPMLFSEAEALAVESIRAFDANDRAALERLLKGRTMQKGALV